MAIASYKCPLCNFILDIDKDHLPDHCCCPYCGNDLRLSANHMPEKVINRHYKMNFDSFFMNLIVKLLIFYLVVMILSYLNNPESSLVRFISEHLSFLKPIGDKIQPIIKPVTEFFAFYWEYFFKPITMRIRDLAISFWEWIHPFIIDLFNIP